MIFILFFQFIQSTPFGAPGCGINKTTITKGMGIESELGYKLQVIPAGGNTWNISLKNDNRNDYQGLLIYVSPVTNLKTHLGEWSFKNLTKWKYQPRGLCTSQGVTGGDKSTVTHAVPDRVGLGVTFQWKGSDEEVAMDGLVVNGVVASLDQGKTGLARWQKLEFFGIPPTIRNSTAYSTNTSLPPPTTTQIIATSSTDTLTDTTPPSSQKTHTVLIGPGLSYTPPFLLISKGDTVSWNFASSPHTVTEANGCQPIPGGFDSKKQVSPNTFQTVIDKRTEYMCTVGDHCLQGMKGVIEVQDGNGTMTSDPVRNGAMKKCYIMVLLVFCLL